MQIFYAALILFLTALCQTGVSRSEETSTQDEDLEAADSMISEILGTRPVQVLSEAPTTTTTLRPDLAPVMPTKTERLSSLQEDLAPAKSTPAEANHDGALRNQIAIQQEFSAARTKLNELDGVIQSSGSAIKSRLESLRRKVLMLTSAL